MSCQWIAVLPLFAHWLHCCYSYLFIMLPAGIVFGSVCPSVRLSAQNLENY